MYSKIVAIIVIKVTLLSFMGQQAVAQNINTTAKQLPFKVKKVNFEGNTVFSDSELEKIVAPLKGREVNPEEIFELKEKFTNYYVSRGYENSGAFIPPQNIADGDITVKIVEGRLVGVEIRGLRHLDKNYIKARLPDLAKPLNRIELSKSLAKLYKNPLIKSLSGEIKSQGAGKTVLLLDVKEAPPITASATLTDGYTPSIGRFGNNSSISYNNLLGSGDELNINGSLTDGLWRIGSFYSFLINESDGRITLGYNVANVKNIESVIKPLGIEADYEAISLKFSQPIVFTPTEKLTVGLAIEQIQSETFVLGNISFPFVEGLPDGNTNITNLQFFQEYIREGLTTYLLVSSRFNVGIDVFDVTRSEAGIDGIAWFWEGEAQHFKFLSKNTILFNRVSIQLTPDQLLPLQQDTLGGISTVKGYRTNLTLGDNIVFGDTELRFIVVKDEKFGSITIIPFFNWGTVWNNKRETPGSNTFVSVGLGLRYIFRNSIEFRINYAAPLVDATGYGATDTEENFSFYIALRRL